MSSIDRTTFFAYCRAAPFGGRLSSAQLAGLTVLLERWDYFKMPDERFLAYVLASVFHETGGRIEPVREAFAKSDAAAKAALEKAWKAGRLGKVREPYWRDGWFGRGFIQLTHKANYIKLGKRLEEDLVGNPSRAMDPKVSADIAIVGCAEGLFTGAKLSQYFNAKTDDPVGARAIVNGGGDKAKLIAGYYRNFLDALRAASKHTPLPPDVKPEAAKPDDVPVKDSKSLWTILLTAFPGLGGLSFFANINNPFALVAFALLLTGGAVGLWLVVSGRVTIKRGGAA